MYRGVYLAKSSILLKNQGGEMTINCDDYSNLSKYSSAYWGVIRIKLEIISELQCKSLTGFLRNMIPPELVGPLTLFIDG